MRYIALPLAAIALAACILSGLVTHALADEATCGTDSECVQQCIHDGGSEEECNSW